MVDFLLIKDVVSGRSFRSFVLHNSQDTGYPCSDLLVE